MADPELDKSGHDLPIQLAIDVDLLLHRRNKREKILGNILNYPLTECLSHYEELINCVSSLKYDKDVSYLHTYLT